MFAYRWTSVFFDPLRIIKAPSGLFWFLNTWRKYRKMFGAEQIKLVDTWPCLHEDTSTHPFNAHYFYQGIWASRKIQESGVPYHVDVGSKIEYVGLLTSVTNVLFVDIRPVKATVENFFSISGDILSLPFRDNSIVSLSCLHVAEHIGLGRYGDPLDPLGTKKALRELSRVLSKGGNLYFSVPVGKPRLCFNAHRIHSPSQIRGYLSDLELIEFSGVDDNREFRSNLDFEALENANDACGFFWFRKP